VNPVRGILMIVASAFAFWRGWQIHHGRYAWMAYGLGVLALALSAWHLTSGRGNRIR
jgi:heme exporter protein D